MRFSILMNVALAALAVSAPTDEKKQLQARDTCILGDFLNRIGVAGNSHFDLTTTQLCVTGGCMNFNSWVDYVYLATFGRCRFYSGWDCKNHEQIGGGEGLRGLNFDWFTAEHRQWIPWALSGTCWWA
ncbi:hypothetical protein IQ07DRAFT_581575 [Pyrenochaeta sp. DS3sAY3a]|nr:hypothetical protein IQ07DRAFT_581575 [Pyrenochaeta sp. DS3sAY3a]